jgi:hypothetical protein
MLGSKTTSHTNGIAETHNNPLTYTVVGEVPMEDLENETLRTQTTPPASTQNTYTIKSSAHVDEGLKVAANKATDHHVLKDIEIPDYFQSSAPCNPFLAGNEIPSPESSKAEGSVCNVYQNPFCSQHSETDTESFTSENNHFTPNSAPLTPSETNRWSEAATLSSETLNMIPESAEHEKEIIDSMCLQNSGVNGTPTTTETEKPSPEDLTVEYSQPSLFSVIALRSSLEGELIYEKEQVIEIIDTNTSDYYLGRIGNHIGWVAHVNVVQESEAKKSLNSLETGTSSDIDDTHERLPEISSTDVIKSDQKIQCENSLTNWQMCEVNLFTERLNT